MFYACMYNKDGWSNHDYIIIDTWSVQPTTGEKPPPLAYHTFTLTGRHTATVFGGVGGIKKYDATYLLDMETWVGRLQLCHVSQILNKHGTMLNSVCEGYIEQYNVCTAYPIKICTDTFAADYRPLHTDYIM